jgi:diguanylate cyclase (GGDEF)-like protein
MVSSFNALVDKLQLSESRMRHLAHHDALTSLPNRMAFQQSLTQGVALAVRQEGSLALLFIDLDGFKKVNDSYGHDVGDQLLVQVATRLRCCVRASDMVGRLGGDEFVLLLTDNPSAEQAQQIADKVIGAISKPYDMANAQTVLGASIGIALYPTHAKSADQLLIMADTAMYVAKRAGGSRHQLAS